MKTQLIEDIRERALYCAEIAIKAPDPEIYQNGFNSFLKLIIFLEKQPENAEVFELYQQISDDENQRPELEIFYTSFVGMEVKNPENIIEEITRISKDHEACSEYYCGL